MTQVKDLVKAGKIQQHSLAGLLRSWLRGRKPTTILVWFWLNYDEGMVLDFASQFAPKTKPRYTCRVVAPKMTDWLSDLPKEAVA